MYCPIGTMKLYWGRNREQSWNTFTKVNHSVQKSITINLYKTFHSGFISIISPSMQICCFQFRLPKQLQMVWAPSPMQDLAFRTVTLFSHLQWVLFFLWSQRNHANNNKIVWERAPCPQPSATRFRKQNKNLAWNPQQNRLRTKHLNANCTKTTAVLQSATLQTQKNPQPAKVPVVSLAVKQLQPPASSSFSVKLKET